MGFFYTGKRTVTSVSYKPRDEEERWSKCLEIKFARALPQLWCACVFVCARSRNRAPLSALLTITKHVIVS